MSHNQTLIRIAPDFGSVSPKLQFGPVSSVHFSSRLISPLDLHVLDFGSMKVSVPSRQAGGRPSWRPGGSVKYGPWEVLLQ